MKFLQILSSIVLTTSLAAFAEVSPIHMDVEQTSKTDAKGKAPMKGAPPSDKVQTRALNIKLVNNSNESFDNLVVKYWFFGRDMKEHEARVLKNGERKATLGPRGRETVESETVTSNYVEAHNQTSKSSGKGAGKGAAKITKVAASGEKIVGFAVQVLNGTKVVAEEYSEDSYKLKLGGAPKGK